MAASRVFEFEWHSIVNTVDPSYPIANKISCFDVVGRADRVLFLDSDIVCLRPLVLEEAFATGFVAKPADVDTFAGDWSAVYKHFGLPEPRQRVRATFSGQLMLPYFNSGVICVPNGVGFGDTWADCSRAIDRLPAVPNKRPNLDQIALPVAVQRLRLPLMMLDERLNFPAHLRPLANDVVLCHYHRPDVIRREPRLREEVMSLLDEHPVLAEIAADHPSWRRLAGRGRLTNRGRPAVRPQLRKTWDRLGGLGGGKS